MPENQFDGTRYKVGQRHEWDGVADAWWKWWPVFERSGQHVSDRLAELAAVEPGQRVLDVATGIGEPAATVARLVGSQGNIVAIDQSPGMLAVAQRRVAELGLSNVALVEADSESMDLQEEEFDAVVCRWGLMFLPDLAEALARIRRALKPGGRFATSVWSTVDRVAFASLPLGVAQRVLDPPPPPPPPDAPNLFKLGAPGVIEAAFADAGFKEVRGEAHIVEFSVDSPEQYTDFLKDIAPPMRALVADRSAESQESFWQAVRDGASEFVRPDGGVELPSESILVVGTK